MELLSGEEKTEQPDNVASDVGSTPLQEDIEDTVTETIGTESNDSNFN